MQLAHLQMHQSLLTHCLGWFGHLTLLSNGWEFLLVFSPDPDVWWFDSWDWSVFYCKFLIIRGVTSVEFYVPWTVKGLLLRSFILAYTEVCAVSVVLDQVTINSQFGSPMPERQHKFGTQHSTQIKSRNSILRMIAFLSTQGAVKTASWHFVMLSWVLLASNK